MIVALLATNFTVHHFSFAGKPSTYSIYSQSNGEFSVALRWGGKLLRNKNSDQLIGGTAPHFDLPSDVFVERTHSLSGHGQATTYYTLQGGALKEMGTINGECGGPIFRDMDRDGTKEWIFDDYDHYEYYGAPPRWLLVYKVARGNKLILWKRMPNRHHVRLRDYVNLHW